jgi:Dolichyl-phosphate-mannose-protein mannosyltransferase
MISRISAWMKGSGSTGLRLPWRMFWVGLAVRVLYITIGHSYHFRTFQDHFQFGWEVGRIARALVTGYGYADPFTGHTGPTAWSPPLYPLLLAGVFKLCGIYTPLSAWAILALNSIFSAATAPAVYEIAKRCYDNRTTNPTRSVALWSGWLWALYPAASQYAVHWVWETSLTTCLFAWTLVITLRVRAIGDPTPDIPTETPGKNIALWAIFGILWAMIFLCNPTLTLFLPICGLWMLLGRTEKVVTSDRVPHPSRLLRWVGTYKFRAALAKATLSALIFLACIAPWVYRNETAFHAFIPSRSNFGAELYHSMLPEHDGFPWGITVSFVANDPEYLNYKALGEIAYVQQKNELAHALIHAHPQRFAAYALKRVYFFWVGVPHPIEKGWNGWFVEIIREMNFCVLSLAGLMGLALSLHRRIPAARLFAWAFLLLPIPYYFITSGARFRHPLEPLICILAVYLFQSTTPRSSTTRPNEMRSQ